MGTSRDQFKVVILALTSNYRQFDIESKAQFDFWYEMLSDIPYEHLTLAVQKHVAEEKWPPTIADLRKAYTEATTIKAIDANQAWGEAQRAIQYYGIYRPEEALNSMSPITREVVSNMNYRELCLSENQMADRAHFMKMFELYSTRKKKQAQLPPSVKKRHGANTRACEATV